MKASSTWALVAPAGMGAPGCWTPVGGCTDAMVAMVMCVFSEGGPQALRHCSKFDVVALFTPGACRKKSVTNRVEH